MSGFSHASTPSTPTGAPRRRRVDADTGQTESLADVQHSFTTNESPDSHRIIKKSRAMAGSTTLGSDTSPNFSTPTPDSPARPTNPPPPQDTPAIPPRTQEALHLPTPASHLDQINVLLTQALLLAVETVSPSTGLSEHLARSQQLVRTLASHFNVVSHLAEAPSLPSPKETPSTYAAAASSAMHRTPAHNVPLSSRPRPPAALPRKVNKGQPLVSPRSPRQGTSRVIVRFTSPPPALTPGMDLSGLFESLREQLGQIGIPIRAVQPTRSGNLVIHTFTAAAAERLRQEEMRVRSCVEQELDWYGYIALDPGLRWTSVVVHDVPLQPILCGPLGRILVEGHGDRFLELVAKGGNDFGDLTKLCARSSALVRWEDVDLKGIELGEESEEGMQRISMRMDLLDEELALRIRRQGVYVGGEYCRVSQYKARQRRTPKA